MLLIAVVAHLRLSLPGRGCDDVIDRGSDILNPVCFKYGKYFF